MRAYRWRETELSTEYRKPAQFAISDKHCYELAFDARNTVFFEID